MYLTLCSCCRRALGTLEILVSPECPFRIRQFQEQDVGSRAGDLPSATSRPQCPKLQGSKPCPCRRGREARCSRRTPGISDLPPALPSIRRRSQGLDTHQSSHEAPGRETVKMQRVLP